MKGIIRTEIWKALHNKMFYAALTIGTVVAMIDVLESAAIVNDFTQMILDGIAQDSTVSTHYEGFSLFINWIAINGVSYGHMLFYFIWPILAAMPFGWSYYQERRNGICNMMVIRCGAKCYYTAKYIAVFVSGGITIAIPVILNLLATALVSPYCVPDVTSSIAPVFNYSFLSELYYSIPWLYALIWCCVEFLWGGVTACICFIANEKLPSAVMVILAPFVFFVLFECLYSTILNEWNAKIELSPLTLAKAATFTPNPGWVVFTVLFVLVVTSYSVGYWRVVKCELI